MVAQNIKNQRGATMVEYALIVVAIALVAYAGARLLGTNISDKFEAIGTCVTNAS